MSKKRSSRKQAPEPKPTPPRRSPVRLAVDFLSSFGLACVLFVLLLILTFFGTLEQVDLGIHDVQKKYFESFFVVLHLFDTIPVLLPGAYLILALLTVNVLLGGIIRLSKKPSHIGMLITHLGIVLMIIGSFVKYSWAIDGHMTLPEGQQSSEFQSYYLNEIAIARTTEGGKHKEYLVPDSLFKHADPSAPATFTHPDLPFEVTVLDFMRNCQPMPITAMPPDDNTVVDGVFLSENSPAKEAEQNMPGAHVSLAMHGSDETVDALLWGFAEHPLAVEADGTVWSVDLRRKRYPLPFTIHLDKFTRELHPRTQMPSAFRSDVTKIEDGHKQRIKIQMNQPLRHEGYTFFQASFQEADPQRGTPMMSTFAVVNDPADQIPLYSCIVISFGMLVHFTLKLFKYLKKETRRARREQLA